MIKFEQVSKSFGKKQVLKDLSFQVAKEEFVAITGKSGSGKSTILNLVGLLDEPTSGSIRWRGQPLPAINSRKARNLRRNEINYVFQSNALISDISVKKNLLISMEFIRSSMRKKTKQINQVLDLLGIKDLSENLLHTLSGGEQQRVALARCILKPGDLILADEPTGSLDEVTAQKIFDILENLRDHYGKTILMVTHSSHLAQQADRIITLESLA